MPAILLERPLTKKISEDEGEKLERFLKELHLDADAGQEQRELAAEDMAFMYEPGGHWAGFLPSDNENRVKLQFDIVSPYIWRFMSQYNGSRIGVEYKPDDDATTDKDARLLTGARFADFRQFHGKEAQANAAMEVAVVGDGCYKLSTHFEDDSDPENEKQRIGFSPIFNAYNTIIWDSASKMANRSDARRCIELYPYTKESFKEQYQDKDAVSAFNPDDISFSDSDFNKPDTVYVAKRYDIVRKKETVFVYRNLELGKLESYTKEKHELIKDELKNNDLIEFVRERKVIRQTVEKTVFSGADILEKTKRIAGKWIPIIAAYGYRGFADGVEFRKGLLSTLKDSQRLFNVQISQLAENASSGGQRNPIFFKEQIKGLEENWADRNNNAYHVINSIKDGNGNIIVSGPVGYLEPDVLDQSTAELIKITLQFLQQMTGGAPQETLDPATSGKAIQALLKRENQNTQPIMENIVCSREWEGTVYQAIAADIYNTPRLIRTLGKDGVAGFENIHSIVMDEETGKMIEANEISGKKFKAHSDIGHPYDTDREAAIEEEKSMLDTIKDIPAAAKYAPALIASIFTKAVGPGSDIVKKLARQDLILMGLTEPETDEEKQFLAQAQQPKEDPQAKLLEAAAQQQLSEARNLDADSLDNVASAKLKEAQAIKTISDIEISRAKAKLDGQVTRVKTNLQLRKELFENIRNLPLN